MASEKAKPRSAEREKDVLWAKVAGLYTLAALVPAMLLINILSLAYGDSAFELLREIFTAPFASIDLLACAIVLTESYIPMLLARKAVSDKLEGGKRYTYFRMMLSSAVLSGILTAVAFHVVSLFV